jgi:hypothetical protein
LSWSLFLPVAYVLDYLLRDDSLLCHLRQPMRKVRYIVSKKEHKIVKLKIVKLLMCSLFVSHHSSQKLVGALFAFFREYTLKSHWYGFHKNNIFEDAPNDLVTVI